MRSLLFANMLGASLLTLDIVHAKAGSGAGSPPPPPPAGNPPAPPAGEPPQPAAAVAATNAGFEITDDVAMPADGKTGSRGGQSIYPFDKLAAPVTAADGNVKRASFHVAGKTAKNMASTISSANKRFIEQDKNADGTLKFTDKPGPNGTTVREPVNIVKAKFKAYNVGASDPKGVGVRIFRIQ